MLLEMNYDVVNVHKIGYDMIFKENNLVLSFMHELGKRNTLMTHFSLMIFNVIIT